jgi:hypothetical protein
MVCPGETRGLVFTRAAAMATRRAAMTPGLRFPRFRLGRGSQFQLDCCDRSDPVSLLVLGASACPSFWPSYPTVQLLQQMAWKAELLKC